MLRAAGLEVPADHQAHDAVGVEGAALDGVHHPPVPQHRDPVAQPFHLRQPVGDVQHREPVGHQLLDEREQPPRFALGQRRGGLVEDQDARAGAHRRGDLHLLLVGHRQAPQGLVHVQVGAQAGQQRPGAGAQGGAIHQPPAAGPAPQGQVLGHAQLGAEGQLLVHHADAGGQGVGGRGEAPGHAVHDELAPVRREDARQEAPQRGLARAVLAHEPVAGAALDGEVDVVQRDHAAEGLVQPAEDHRGGRGAGRTPGGPGRHFSHCFQLSAYAATFSAVTRVSGAISRSPPGSVPSSTFAARISTARSPQLKQSWASSTCTWPLSR